MATRIIIGLLAVFWPYPLVALFFYATAGGYLNFGGGEKDIVLAAPLALLAVLYSISSIVLWRRGRPVARRMWESLLVALGLVLILWLGLAAWSLIATDILGWA
jgi:hypothetical protein